MLAYLLCLDSEFQKQICSMKPALRHIKKNIRKGAVVQGGTGSVVGRVVDPIYAVLNKGTSVACSTFSMAATQFLVVRGVEEMYDVLLSTHCAKDWGARPDPVTEKLEYRPYLRQGDMHTMASVPLLTDSTHTWREIMAASVFHCCMSTNVHMPRHDVSQVASAPTKQENGAKKELAPACEPAVKVKKDLHTCAPARGKKKKSKRAPVPNCCIECAPARKKSVPMARTHQREGLERRGPFRRGLAEKLARASASSDGSDKLRRVQEFQALEGHTVVFKEQQGRRSSTTLAWCTSSGAPT